MGEQSVGLDDGRPCSSPRTGPQPADHRHDANKALHDLFLGLVDALSQDVTARNDSDIDVRADDQTNCRKPSVVLTNRAWPAADGQAPAAVVIEWHDPPIDKNGEFTLYVGVRVGDRGRRDE